MKLDYETGAEIYSTEGAKRGELLIEESIKTIQEGLNLRNPEKYGGFLRGLEKTELVLKVMNVPEYKKRVQLLRYMYYGLRLLDDICDGDTTTNFSLEDRKKIIEGEYGKGLYDILILETQKIAQELGVLKEIQYSIDEIVGSMKFDIDRIIDENKKRGKDDLEENFHSMDIVGTEYGTAIIFGLIPESTLGLLEGLGIATRMSFNIDDLQEDIAEGLINIPIEELEQYGISNDDLKKLKEGEMVDLIGMWIQGEILKIENLLHEYNKSYSFVNIIKGNGIELFYSTNYFRKVFNNLLLKYLVLPKGYIKGINNVIGTFKN